MKEQDVKMSDIDIVLDVNGENFPIRVEPRRTLVDALREDCGLTGTHIGCEHGVCGACTVLVDDEPVRSCLMFAAQADKRRVETVEGLAHDQTLHPLQQAFMDQHALQCGFCTPGFLMLALGMLRKNPSASDDEIKDAISSNICRCTGYVNILAAVKQARDALREEPKI